MKCGMPQLQGVKGHRQSKIGYSLMFLPRSASWFTTTLISLRRSSREIILGDTGISLIAARVIASLFLCFTNAIEMWRLRARGSFHLLRALPGYFLLLYIYKQSSKLFPISYIGRARSLSVLMSSFILVTCNYP